ncbi:MAG TPA: PQQ-dependent sugar dehydrogenase, partial [Thermoanaerobaculia bacterium]|nr:PQQ-dependent sugar dehydrogenase [Thermoanaerobaculia bacterium]
MARPVEYALLVLAAASYASAAFGQPALPSVATVPRFTSLPSPTHVTNAGDGSGRLFVVLQGGRIRVVKGGSLLQAPFLDIAERVSCCGERGLLSVAFPTGYAAKKVFYVNYTNRNGDTTISRFRLTSNADVADPSSEEILLVIAQPFANHNGGQILFGPDGYLYVGMGDGGSAGDPMNNAQNPASLLGKVLRIDVESATKPYGIPATNPFVGRPGYRAEIFSLGWRNPWRFSFDRATNDFYAADVGQNQYEEVDFAPAGDAGGENYGWRTMEGLHCFSPATGCSTAGLEPPVAEYSHSLGCSVTGGFVYRGPTYARLSGIYFYGDYCSGRIWGLKRSAGAWQNAELLKTSLGITSFGEDEAGEIYVADQNGNAVLGLVDPTGPSATRVVPVVVDAPGVGGARFTSDLILTNRGTTAATAVMTYTAAASLGASGSGTATETIPAGRTFVVDDVISYLRGKGVAVPASGSQAGSLRVVFEGIASADAASASARTSTPSGAGRAGVAYPGVAPSFAPKVRLFGLRQTDADRTNLALENEGVADALTLRVTLVSGAGDGRVVTLPDVTLAPGEWKQLDGVLAGAGLTNAVAEVERVGGTDPFIAYAVFNDNRTGDGSFVDAVSVTRDAASQTLPVLVETPAFESELILANPTDGPQTVTLEYVESLAAGVG